METQLALRVHEDVAARHERLLQHADARRRRVVGLVACGQARLQRVPVVVALAPAHREVAARDHVLVEDARVCGGHRLALRPHALAVVCAAPTTHSVCARFTLFSHVVWFRSTISPGSAPVRTASSSPRTTPRRPPGAPSRAPTPRRRAHFGKPAFFCGIEIPLLRKKEREKEFFPSCHCGANVEY